MRSRALIPFVLLLTACGAEPSPKEAVREALRDFNEVVAERDVQELCDRILARELKARIARAGLPCEVAVRPALQAAEKPTLEIRKITLKDDRAEALVVTKAANQPASTDRIRLVRERGAWRVASLAGQG